MPEEEKKRESFLKTSTDALWGLPELDDEEEDDDKDDENAEEPQA